MAVYSAERVGIFPRIHNRELLVSDQKKEKLSPPKGFDWMYKSSIEEKGDPHQSWLGRYWRREFAVPFEMLMRRVLVVNAESPDKKRSIRMF